MQVASLYQDHHLWLKQFLYRKLNCQAQAADIAQDTFLRILNKQKRNALEQIHSPKAYLTTLATGLVNNHWRRLSIEQAYIETLAAQPQHTAPSPETQQQIVDILEQLAQVLEKLPKREQQVFIMARIDGLAYKDIAVQLQITVNMVQKAMCKAVLACIEVQNQ